MRSSQSTPKMLGVLALTLVFAATLLCLQGCASCSTTNTQGADTTSSKEDSVASQEEQAGPAVQPEQADPLWVLNKVDYTHTGGIWGDSVASGTTEYTRDERGNLQSVTSDEGLTTYEYDKNGNPLRLTTSSAGNSSQPDASDGPASAANSYAEDNAQAEALGITDLEAGADAESDYEEEEAVPAGDEAEDPAEASAESAQISNEFDEKGRLVRTTVQGISTTEYSYDDKGNVSKVTNVITTPDYDENGNEAGTLTYTVTTTYDANGFPTEETRDWGDGAPTKVSYTWETADEGLPSSGTCTVETPSSTYTSTFALSYDEHGNIARLERTNGDETYTATYTWSLVDKPSEYVRMLSTIRQIPES